MSEGTKNDLPVDPKTGTASTDEWSIDAPTGSTESGFQETSNQEDSDDWSVDSPDTPNIDTSTSVTKLDWAEYEDHIGQAFIPEGGIEALDRSRADSQSTLDQAANTVVKTGLGAALGVVENAGYLFDLEAHANTVTGVGNDYSNFITEFASEGRAALDKSFPVYRENPNETFDLADPAWWLTHGGSLGESILEFAATGIGVGKVLGGGAKMLAGAMKASAQTAGLLTGTTRALTAMELAYVEGAMGGQQVYKETYDKALSNGISEDEAVSKASRAAALAVQLNTVINTGLNVTGASMFTRPMGGARKLAKGFKRQAGETLGDWTTRLKQGAKKSGGAATVGLEMGQESLEEVVNEIATSIGGRKGEELLGLLSDEDKKSGLLGTIIETLGKEETALSAILGAIGGGGQHLVTSQLPSAKARKKAESDFEQTQLNHVVDRVEAFEAAQAKASKASEAGDVQGYEEAVNEVFTTEAMSSIINGTEDQLSGIYEEVANMSPDEAKAKGYDVSNGPDNYKTRAQEAIRDIEKLSNDYQEIVYKHNADDTEAESVGYGQNVFYKHLNKYNAEQRIDKATQRLEKAKAENAKQNQRRGTSMGIVEAIELQNDIKAKDVAISKIASEIDEVKALDSRSKAGRRSILNKYGMPPKGTSLKQHATNVIEAKAKRLTRAKGVLEGILNKEERTFKENGGKASEFEEALNTTSAERFAIQEAQSQIDSARETLKDMDADYKRFTTKEGRDQFVKSTQEENARERTESKKDEEDFASEQRAEQDRAKKQEAKDKVAEKKRQEEAKKEARKATSPMGEQQVQKQEEVVEPVLQTEQEINTEIVEEGLVASDEVKPELPLEDGEVVNATKKNKEDMYKTEESQLISENKVVEAANSFAYRSKDFVADEQGFKTTKTNDKAKDLHKELESSKHFQVGDSITLEIDKTATWVDEKTGKTWSYEDFVTDGVVDVANVPIAIKKGDQVVAFIRTQNWIKQKDKNDNYANVANDVDPTSPMHGNAEKQAALNLSLRKSIVNGGSITTTITDKKSGSFSHNYVKGKKARGVMSELTPKLKTFTIVKNGQFHTTPSDIYSERGLANTEDFTKDLNEYSGLVFGEFVTPNGKAMMAPVSIPNLNMEQVETIMQVLEDKFKENNETRKAIFAETDLDVTTDSGMLDFMRLFTHVMDESEANFKEKVNGEKGNSSSRFLNYSTKTGQLSFAKHQRGITTITSAEEFEANRGELMVFLSDKLFSVRLSAINKPEGVSVPIVRPAGAIGGNLEVKNYENYNEYIKTVLKTDILGNEISEDEDTYFDQPTINFSQDFVDLTPAEREEEISIGGVIEASESTITDEDLLNNIDSIMGFDDSISYEKSQDIDDFEMTDLNRDLLNEGLKTFLVVDSVTGKPYNSYKQSQVVDSLLEVVARGMQKGATASEAFKLANKLFNQRQQLYAAAEDKFDKLTDDQKRKLAITSIGDAQELHDEFEKVLRNWGEFSKHASIKLASVFGIKKTIGDKADEKAFDMLDGYEEIESALEKVSFDDGAAFQTNHKDTASARLKLFLALQESPVRTFLNLKSFMPFDTVYNELQMMLAGTEPSYDKFVQAMSLKGATKAYTSNLISKLDSSSQQVKNEFVTAFSKQYTKFAITLWNKGKNNGVEYLQMQNIEANRNSVTKRVEAQWIEDQKSSDIVKVVGGKLTINESVAAKFKESIDTLSKEPTVEGTEALLKSIGINMPTEAIKYLKDNSVAVTGQSFDQHFKSGMFKHMSNALNRTHDKEVKDGAESLLDLNNPLTGVDREGSSVKILATLTSQFNDAIYSNSHKDSEGKTIYSYSLNTALSHTVRELKADNGANAKLDGLSKLSFSKNSHWGTELRTNSKFRDSFDVQYLDGLAKRKSNKKGVKRNAQSDREMELQAMSLFQNQGRDVGNFVYPTISDKTTTPVISALKHESKVLFELDGSYTFGKSTKTMIHNLVRSEIDRIENYKPSKDKIKGYDNGGAKKFFLFPGLNEIAEGNFNKDGSIPLSVQTKLFATAEAHMKELIDRTVKSWEDLDIKTDTNLMFDQTYLNSIRTKVGKNPTNSKLATYGAIDMEINYMIANANSMQLISGDPATHFKGTVEKTLNDYTKRLAKDIAPGLDGNFSNKRYNTIYMADKETNSQHLENYKSVIKSKSSAYTGMEGTDAQEYTTLKEHLNVMQAYGKISDSEFLRFKKKQREGTPFSGKELDIILQPMKPVYVGSEPNFERDVNVVTYIKSSAFPLIPQLTSGLEINKLRTQMERHGIDRAAYVSATKLGATKVVDVWDGDKMKEDFSLEGSAVSLSRDGFRIQQEVPYKEDKTKVLTVSQMNKLLFEGILDIDGMTELKARKEEIRKEMFKNGKDSLIEAMGAIQTKDPSAAGGFSYKFEDLSKVKDVLIKEARDRNFPINDIQALELSEDKKSFKLPLGFNASSKKFESVLMSLVTNRVLKQKLPGKSYVQGSSAGFRTGDNHSKSWSELTDKELGGVVFTESANMDKGLLFAREENGKVLPAQMLAPFYFRDEDGKPLDILQYTTKVDGKTMIDHTKIDKSLMNLIGARIPNQGHSSMLPIEIVGFLPESMGDLIIVPDEITKQMGSDFDVDKLYTYNAEYTIADGNISKNDGLINEYIDIHWSVLTHPEVLPRVLAPLDQKGAHSVAGEAELIHGIRSANANPESMLYRRNQQTAFIQNRGGKSGVGIFSLASTFNATIQDQNVHLGNTLGKKIFIESFAGHKLNKLSGKGTNKIADKAAVISDMQSAAVDNAKEQTLDKLNLNDVTFGVANAMAQLETESGKNLDIQYISRFLSQQIILDYVTEFQKLDDSTVDGFTADKESTAIDKVRAKYAEKAFKKDAIKLSPENMLQMIKDEATPNGNWYADQITVLDAFEELMEVGSGLTNLQAAINSDSKGVSPSYFQVTDKIDRITALNSNPTIRGFENLTTHETEVGYATQEGPILAKALMENFLPQGSNAINATLDLAKKISASESLSPDMKQRIFDGYKGFMFASDGWLAADVDATRMDLLLDDDTSSLATRVKEAQETWGKDNFLLRRLMPKFSDIKGDPATIEYVASTGEQLDEQEAIKAFVDMMASSNPEIAKLAQDLVTYSFLTSGTQHANNFIKFIPTIYLNVIGLDTKLNDYNWNSGQDAYNFMTQFVQTNPDFTPSMSDEMIERVKDNQFTLPKIGTENNPFTGYITMENVNGIEEFDYVDFVQTKTPEGYELFRNKGVNEDGEAVFARIDTLGGKGGIVEYNSSITQGDSLYQGNYVEVKKLPVILPKTQPSQEYSNPSAHSAGLAEYDLKRTDDKEGVAKFIDKVKNESLNPAHRIIAEIFQEKLSELTLTVFKTDLSGSLGRYTYNEGEDILNVNLDRHIDENGNINSNKFEETMLHELTHGYTGHILRTFKTSKTISPEVKKAARSIETLRGVAFSKLLSTEEQAEAKEFLNDLSEGVQSSDLPRSSKVLYYALSSPQEFATLALTDIDFQKRLNEIPFEGKKSLLDRFMELVGQLFKAIGSNMGMSVKENSLLEASVTEIMNLIEKQKSADSTGDGFDSSIVMSGKTPNKVHVVGQVNKELLRAADAFHSEANGGKLKRMSLTDAKARARFLNTKSDKFAQYTDKYEVTTTQVPGEKGDKRTYYTLAFLEDKKVSDNMDDFAEFEVDSSVNAIMNRLKDRIKSVKKSMSNSKSNKVVYQERIDKLEDQLEMLETENSLKAISSVAKTQLDWVANLLDKPTVNVSELTESEHVLNVWQDIKTLFKDDYSGQYKETLSQISNRAEDLDNVWRKIAGVVTLKEVNNSSAREVLKKDLEIMNDVSAQRTYMLDLSRVDNPVTQALDTWLKDAARDTNFEFTEQETELSEAMSKLKETAEYKKNKFDIFLQKNPKGNWTGGLVTRYSQSWYDEVKKQTKKRDRKKDSPVSWRNYFDFRKKNEVIVDVRSLLDEKGNLVNDSSSRKQMSKLTSEFGEDRAKDMVQQAKDKYAEYLQDLDAYTMSIENNMLVDSSITEDDKNALIKKWSIENSPRTYISHYMGQAIIKGVKMRGYKYTVSKPKKTINGKSTGWYDDNFAKIESNPELKEFYDYYRKSMAESLSELPTYDIQELQSNFIPNIKKTLMQQFSEKGMRGARAGLWENFSEVLSSNEMGAVSADRSHRTGAVNKRIPVRFLQETDVEDKNKDLAKSLELFKMMALNHKHKSKVEDKALILQRLVNESIEQQLNVKGENQRDTEGKLYQVTDGLVNLKKMVKHTIDASLYNDKKKQGAPTGVVIAKGGAKDSMKATKIAKEIKDLNTKYKLGQIKENVFNLAVEPLQEELTRLGGRNVTTSDVADTILKFTQAKSMGLNIATSINNLSFGLIHNVIHSTGGEDFTTKESLKAYKMMLSSTAKSMGFANDTSKKIAALMKKFDVMFEVDENQTTGTSTRSDMSKLSIYELQKRSEYFVQGQNLVARMLNEKVKTLDGKETSLFEAFDKNGKWRSDVYGENNGWDGDVNNSDDLSDFKKFRSRIIQLNKRIHGNYDPNSYPMAKRAVMGRFALQFKSWLAESVATRFEKQKWDEQLGRNVKGTYQTIADLGFMKTLNAFSKLALMKGNKLDLSPVDEANLRKAMAELTVVLTLMISGLLLKSMGDDDDEDKVVYNLALNQLNKLQRDMTFFMNPASFASLSENPIPAIRTFTDAGKAIGNTVTIVMEDEDVRGSKGSKGEEILDKMLRAVPIANQYGKLKAQGERILKN